MKEKCDCNPNRYSVSIKAHSGRLFSGPKGNVKVGRVYMHRYFVNCTRCHNTLVTYRFFVESPSKYEIGL